MNTLDTQQQLFAITAEECGELTQVCMKILRKANVDATWNKRLLEEVGDVYCMLDLIVQHGYLNWLCETLLPRELNQHRDLNLPNIS